ASARAQSAPIHPTLLVFGGGGWSGAANASGVDAGVTSRYQSQGFNSFSFKDTQGSVAWSAGANVVMMNEGARAGLAFALQFGRLSGPHLTSIGDRIAPSAHDEVTSDVHVRQWTWSVGAAIGSDQRFLIEPMLDLDIWTADTATTDRIGSGPAPVSV